jgi:hypothetical protein
MKWLTNELLGARIGESSQRQLWIVAVVIPGAYSQRFSAILVLRLDRCRVTGYTE